MINGYDFDETIYDGELLPHHVLVGGVAVDIIEEGTYAYTELGLTASDFSGGLVPDCKTKKIAKVYCEECSTFIGVYATGEHKYNAEPDKNEDGSVKTLAPTCTDDGYNAIYSCIACGKSKVNESDKVSYTGHEWTAEVVEGKVKLTCSACDTVIEGIIDEIDNTSNAPECGIDGTITYYYYENQTDADAETNRKFVVVKAAALEHDFEDANVIEFEIVKNGKTYVCKAKQCNNCELYYIFEQVEKVVA